MALTLAVSLTVAGFAATAYSNERDQLGRKHFQSGEWSLNHADLDGAVDQFRKALLFSPDKEQYRLALAESLVRANHLDEAQVHLEQLVQEDPGNGRVNSLLAQIAEKRGHVKEAIDRYERAVYEYWAPEMIPYRRAARRRLINLLEKSNRPGEAIAELIQLNSSATNPAEKARIAFELLNYGAVSEAARIFHDLAATNSNNTDVRRGLGEVEFDNGRFVSARHEFQTALRIDPKDLESEQWLAETNEVIDLDPLLAGISSAERLRRSQNLLNAVVQTVTKCNPGVPSNEDAAAELAAANQLLTSKRNVEGRSDLLQQSAEQLWRDRRLFCGSGLANQDRAVETAMARIAGE